MAENKQLVDFKKTSRRARLIVSGIAGTCVFICAAPVLLWVAGSGVAASFVCTPKEALIVAGVFGLLSIISIFALRKPNTSCDCVPVKEDAACVACDLTVFTDSERAEHKALGDALFAKVKHIVELSNGFTLIFDPELKLDARINKWVEKEKMCCPFFTFETTHEDATTSYNLRIFGPLGTKEILRSEFEVRNMSHLFNPIKPKPR
jgi:hypothetical protein